MPLLPITGAHLSMVTAICTEQSLEGIRGDLAIIKTARALAAWENAKEIGADHIRKAATLALPHRLRRRKSVSPSSQAGLTEPPPSGMRYDNGHHSATETDRRGPPADGVSRASAGIETVGAESRATPASQPAAVDLVTDIIDRESVGRRGTGSSASGRAVRATPYDQTGVLAINETLTVAATRGRRVGERGLSLSPADVMQRERSGPGRSHVLFLVDASASMATRRRLELAKSAGLGLLRSGYQKRDEVALMTFRGERSDVVVPFTSDVESVEAALSDVPTGGRTPLARALLDASELLRTRDPALIVVFTDGRANVSASEGDPWQESLAACRALKAACAGALVIDCEAGPIVLGRARQLAAELDADCIALNALQSNDLTVQILRRIEALP
jgi:magnesium chelatase subunit D